MLRVKVTFLKFLKFYITDLLPQHYINVRKSISECIFKM